MAKVYFGSVAVTKPAAPSTLPGKLQRILKKCNLTKLCSGDWVPIKMHLGGGLGYSTVHPLLVRMVTEAVQEAGGKPVVVDGYFETVAEAHLHGYTRETVGCPIVAAGGVFNSHVVEKRAGYLSYDTAEIFGLIAEAKCLINLSHVKGHGVCAYGGACKNIAMGCVTDRTRHEIHALEGGLDGAGLLRAVLSDFLEAGLSTTNRKASLRERYEIMCRYYGKFQTILLHGWFAIRFYWAKWVRGRV